MALHEETLVDHNFGRIMNANIAEYHVPVNADVRDIEVIFVDEPDDIVNPLGIKGLGEIGIVGVAAAIANAVYHATGKRVRDLPITLVNCSGENAANRSVLRTAASRAGTDDAAEQGVFRGSAGAAK
jgi:CO/xanthine dehydrogenase Mo-binding subunit